MYRHVHLDGKGANQQLSCSVQKYIKLTNIRILYALSAYIESIPYHCSTRFLLQSRMFHDV